MFNNTIQFEQKVGANGYYSSIIGANDIPRLYIDGLFNCYYHPFYPLLDPAKYEEFPDLSHLGVSSFGIVDYLGDISTLPIYRAIREDRNNFYSIVCGSIYSGNDQHMHINLSELGPYHGSLHLSNWSEIVSRRFGDSREIELCVFSCFRLLSRVPRLGGLTIPT